ncbi:uncharacterized protein LOC142613385 isoform X2 [Castanea sativa]|uniref:uncharacterized protein LOC142613385 isoform X2 n=1 Tax=Castanea sativa TaxID=21020 RepID=UPI003F64CD09
MVFQPAVISNLLTALRKMEMGVWQRMVTLFLGGGQLKETLKRTGWNSNEEEMLGLLLVDECPTLVYQFLMNIIIWNCRGALKPSFQNRVRELVQFHNPAILVVMKTRVGGNRAREIIDRLPFDGAIRTDAIGFAGGLWVLWNSDRVDVSHLSSTEQEIHITIKAFDISHSADMY